MREIVAKVFEISPDTEDFHRQVFSRCTFVLKGGDARFLMCDFIECTFVPPIMGEDGTMVREWDDLTAGCVVRDPRTRTLIKADQVAAIGAPKLENPCRLNPNQACYTPDRCVFSCGRGSSNDHPGE